MKQTRKMSFIESLANVGIGYGVAVTSQVFIFPLFGLHTSLKQNLLIGGIFTLISIARSYFVRRLFEAVRA